MKRAIEILSKVGMGLSFIFLLFAVAMFIVSSSSDWLAQNGMDILKEFVEQDYITEEDAAFVLKLAFILMGVVYAILFAMILVMSIIDLKFIEKGSDSKGAYIAMGAVTCCLGFLPVGVLLIVYGATGKFRREKAQEVIE